MGQTLSEPVTEKTTSSGGNDSIFYAISEMQGWRISMEDSHCAILDIKNPDNHIVGSFFGVFDGHGGSSIAQYCGRTLHSKLQTEDTFKEGDYEMALKNAFLNIDEDLKNDPNYTNDPSGCTAVTALILTASDDPKRIERVIVANAGDSRCVLSIGGRAYDLSEDHKPGMHSERRRIEDAGGYVSLGRVNGNLALSRAIGDFEFKRNHDLPAQEQMVTAFPELNRKRLESEDEFIVLACDGIWDCLSSQDVINIVRQSVGDGKELNEICEDLMDRCLAPATDTAGVGCDNMTVCIVALLNGRTKEEWYSWIKDNINVRTRGHATRKDVQPVFTRQSSSRRQRSGLDDMVGVPSVLSGGLERGQGGDDKSAVSLETPFSMMGALGGAGFVYQPRGRSEEGEEVYEAHVVDDNDSGDDNSDGSQEQSAKSTADTQPNLVDSPRTDAKAASSAQESDKMEVDAEEQTSAKAQDS